MLTLSRADYDQIEGSLQQAKSITRAPIFVHVAHFSKKDVMKSALRYFHHTALTHVPEKNAVLIFIAKRSARFCILGDQAAHDELGDEFWQAQQEAMLECFSKGDFVAGIEQCIHRIATALAESFAP